MALDRHPSERSAARHARSDAVRDQERSDRLRTALHGGGRTGRRRYWRNRTPPRGRASVGRRVTRSPQMSERIVARSSNGASPEARATVAQAPAEVAWTSDAI